MVVYDQERRIGKKIQDKLEARNVNLGTNVKILDKGQWR